MFLKCQLDLIIVSQVQIMFAVDQDLNLNSCGPGLISETVERSASPDKQLAWPLQPLSKTNKFLFFALKSKLYIWSESPYPAQVALVGTERILIVQWILKTLPNVFRMKTASHLENTGLDLKPVRLFRHDTSFGMPQNEGVNLIWPLLTVMPLLWWFFCVATGLLMLPHVLF